eukprot:1160754-Pelagomonas_calceolata.AAC.2
MGQGDSQARNEPACRHGDTHTQDAGVPCSRGAVVPYLPDPAMQAHHTRPIVALAESTRSHTF